MSDGVPFWAFMLVGVVLVLGIALMAQQHAHLVDEIQVACAQTSAAAKLDLGSFVPLCEQVK